MDGGVGRRDGGIGRRDGGVGRKDGGRMEGYGGKRREKEEGRSSRGGVGEG